MSNVVIVSRHAGQVEWLKERGITGEIIPHATPEQVRGKDVVGNLPLHLAALANSVAAVNLPNLPADLRGQDLTPAQMDEAGATHTFLRRATSPTTKRCGSTTKEPVGTRTLCPQTSPACLGRKLSASFAPKRGNEAW